MLKIVKVEQEKELLNEILIALDDLNTLYMQNKKDNYEKEELWQKTYETGKWMSKRLERIS
mgnify:CR=1 FL=1